MPKILIIEDEQILREQMAQVLRFEGFEILEAENGILGVALATTSVPDIVVCDVMMPEMDGFGVLQALRENPKTAMIPFIFLTALVADEDLRHGMNEGADDYITKPYNPETLIGSVRRRLEKRHRQIEESRSNAEGVSLAVAASIPQEFLKTLDHITTVTNLLALKFAGDDPEVSIMQQSVVQETLRLRRMMRRLHLYAQLPRLYANRFELVRTSAPAEAASVIERISKEVAGRWKRETDLILEADASQLPMDEEYLILLVEELVDNACKFSRTDTPIGVKGHRENHFWSLVVSSFGSHLTADQIAHIGAFKQFWSGSKKPEGLGIGLALTQGITRIHGCEFTLESDAGTTTATILIPLEA